MLQTAVTESREFPLSRKLDSAILVSSEVAEFAREFWN